MTQGFQIFFRIGQFGMAPALVCWIILKIWKSRGLSAGVPAKRIIRGLLIAAAAAAVCFFLYRWTKEKMSPGVFRHMTGMILWGAALAILYKCYCGFSEIDMNPAVLARLMIIPVIVGLCFLIWPFVEASDKHSHENWVQNLLQCIHYAWRTFVVNNSFEEIWTAMKAIPDIATAGDRTYISVLVVLAPLLTLTVALSFFTVPVFMMKLLFLRGTRVYIFSELNDRSVRYAQALQHTALGAGLQRKPLIAFCATKEAEKKSRVSLNALNAVILNRSVDHLRFIWIAKKRRIRFYLIADDENTKIQQAKNLREQYRNKCYIRCVSPERSNEAKIDELNNAVSAVPIRNWIDGIMKKLNKAICGEDGDETKKKNKWPHLQKAWKLIRDKYGSITIKARSGDIAFSRRAQMIRSSSIEAVEEARRALYTELYERPILTEELLRKLQASSEGKTKTVNILVLGGGKIGSELARICLWYCQLPGISVNVTVADAVSDAILRTRVLGNSLSKDDFDAEQRIIFEGQIPAWLDTWGETNLMTDALLSPPADGKKTLSAKNFHIIFVCTGNDDRNYQLSLRLRRYYLRKENEWGCPDIRTVIWNDTMAGLMDPKKHRALSGDPSPDIDYGFVDAKGEIRFNPRCAVSLFGNMSDSVWKGERLWFDALRYHAYYSKEQMCRLIPYSDRHNASPNLRTFTIRMQSGTIASYCLGPESNRRSSMALAIHGKCKEEWRKVNQHLQKAMETELARAEHTRWCIYELLEGHCPVPDGREGRYFNVKANEETGRKAGPYQKKSRDADEVRGYHVVMRSWKKLKNYRSMENQVKKDGIELDQINWDEWKKAYENNEKLVRFSHAMETWNAAVKKA